MAGFITWSKKMNFLKNLFGGGGKSGQSDRRGFYIYVRPKRCDEIVEVRIDLMNELSLTDDNSGYFVRKIVHATRCPFPAEIYLYFDKTRRAVEIKVSDGEILTVHDYENWLAKKKSASS